jgi:hypothetical protein
MKNANKFVGLIAMAIIAIAIIGCKQDEPADTPKVQPATPRTFTLDTTSCKVTITSNDLFTTAEWNTLCDKVVAAIEVSYITGSQGSFRTIFSSTKNTKVVLGNNFTYNWEVKAGEFDTAYIKTASISTANFNSIVTSMGGEIPGKDPA